MEREEDGGGEEVEVEGEEVEVEGEGEVGGGRDGTSSTTSLSQS